jgi:hypothetical protein
MTLLFKLPIMVVLWAGMFVIKFLGLVLGLFIIPYMWLWRNWHYNIVLERRPWVSPWLNPEDWYGTVHHYASSLPKWWVDKHGINFKSFYLYHAIRNPANGLRNIEWLDLDIVPDKVRFKTNYLMERYEPNSMRKALPLSLRNTAWYIAWQGFQAGFKYVHLWPELKTDVTLFGWTVLEKGPRHFVAKLGWRVEPHSVLDRDIPQVLIDDASFASKLLPYRRG